MVHDRCICQASAIRMNADPIDAIPFFSQHWAVISCLWCTFCIASYFDSPIFEWKKQKSILGKLSAEIVGDYARLKAALLQEFKLSANAYLEHVHFIVSILFRLCFVRACVCDCMCVCHTHICVHLGWSWKQRLAWQSSQCCGLMQIKNTRKLAIFCPCHTEEIMESSYIQQLISAGPCTDGKQHLSSR